MCGCGAFLALQVLRGDRIENSLYELFAGVEEACKVLCRQTYDQADSNEFGEKVSTHQTPPPLRLSPSHLPPPPPLCIGQG